MNKFLKDYYLLILLIVTIVGGSLRFANLNWDLGNYFHPDERNIANAVSKISFFNQLNPEFFAYGGFTIYLIRFIVEILTLITKNNLWVLDWGYINLVGRYLSAFFSTLTIPLIFLLGKKVFDKKTGILAAIIFAFIPTSIQIAHFAVTESFLTMMGILICYLTINFYKETKNKKIVLVGITLGIAIAAKTSAISFAIFPLIALIILALRDFKKIHKFFLVGILLLLTSFLTFSLFSPFTFISWTKFLESMDYESGVVSGRILVPYILQFTNTTPYLFQIQNMFWQIGVITIPAILGLIYLLYLMVVKRDGKVFIFGTFTLIYFLYIGSWHTKFLRYMLPLVPFLVILASLLIIKIQKNFNKLGFLIIGFYILITIIWGFGFFSIYTREQTRVTASRWIYSNIPENSKILTEHWDDGLPITLPNTNKTFLSEQLEIYNQDNSEKKEYYSKKLSEADYIIINSRRLYGTLVRLDDKYPITSNYYKLLFAEKLGYQKIREFSSYPEIFGFEINDDDSEETFQVYDHPKVIIFENVQRFSKDQINQLL